jgi:putative hydrolase of the HAD superfamily
MNKRFKPKAVIFDLGSTLIEYPSTVWDQFRFDCIEAGWKYLEDGDHRLPSRDILTHAFEEVREELRVEAERSLKEWSIPQAARMVLERLGINGGSELSDRFFDAYYGIVEKHLFVFEDTVPTLARIKASIGKIGLISNTIFPERAHRKEISRFEIEPYLDFTIFSSTYGLRKPHPDIFSHGAELAGCDPSECVYIGDRYIEDVTGPHGVGMKAILRYHPDREYPENMPEDLPRIKTLGELTNYLDI